MRVNQVLRDNLDTFVPEDGESTEARSRLVVYVSVAGVLLALAGITLPWSSIFGVRVSSSGSVAPLAVAILALALGRYFLPRFRNTLAWLQVAVGGLGLVVAVGPVLQTLRLAQIPLLGLFVAIGPGALLTAAGFALVVIAAWLDRD